MTGSAPGPAKVATRMVLLRMGLFSAPKSYHASLPSRQTTRPWRPTVNRDRSTSYCTPPTTPCYRMSVPFALGVEVSHGGPSRFLFLLRQHPLLFVGHAHRRACVRGRGRGALAAVQSARNLDRAEQYRVHEERREDELFLARRRATRAPPQDPVRRPGAIPGRSRSPRAAGGPHRSARKMVRRLLARHISRLVQRSARARCRRSRR